MFEQKNDQDNKNTNQQATNQPVALSGGGTGSSGSRLANYSSGQPQSPGSGRFTNLQKYIGANQGAGEQLQQRVTSNVEQGLDKAASQATSQASQIGQKIEQQKQDLNQGQSLASQIKEDPTKITQNQNQLDLYKKLATPQNFGQTIGQQAQTTQDQINAQLNAQQQNIQNLGSEAGRFQLLKQSVNQPNYTTGQQRLDQLFLQNQGGRGLEQKQQNLQQNLGNTQTSLQSTFGDITNQAKNIGVQEQDVSQQLQKALTGSQSDLASALTTKANQLNTQRADQQALINSYLTGGKAALTPEQYTNIQQILKNAGLSEGMRTYGVLHGQEGINKYISQGKTGLTAGDVMSQSDLDRYQALATLAGMKPEEMLYKQVGDTGSDFNINAEKLKSDIAAAKTGFEQSLKNTNAAGQFKNTAASANEMDLLNFLTNGGKYGTYGDYQQQTGYLTPIQLKTSGSATPGQAILTPGSSAYLPNASFGSTEGVGWGKEASQELLKNFINDLNSKGYNEGLGVDAGTGFVDPYAKVKLY